MGHQSQDISVDVTNTSQINSNFSMMEENPVEETQKKLNKIQTLTCMGSTGVMNTTLTAALGVLLNLPPRHIYSERKKQGGQFTHF